MPAERLRLTAAEAHAIVEEMASKSGRAEEDVAREIVDGQSPQKNERAPSNHGSA